MAVGAEAEGLAVVEAAVLAAVRGVVRRRRPLLKRQLRLAAKPAQIQSLSPTWLAWATE